MRAADGWREATLGGLIEVKHGHVLTPGSYVGAAEVEDGGEPFDEKMQWLTGELHELFDEADQLEAQIKSNLGALGYGG